MSMPFVAADAVRGSAKASVTTAQIASREVTEPGRASMDDVPPDMFLSIWATLISRIASAVLAEALQQFRWMQCFPLFRREQWRR
jgi:hypothetical protein